MHDASQHIENLLLTLADDKTPISFLLGAGCPAAVKVTRGGKEHPLIPPIEPLTQRICKQLATSELADDFAKLHEMLKRSLARAPNIEELLSHTRGLLAVCLNNDIAGVSPRNLERIEAEICRQTTEAVNERLTGDDSPYHKLASWVSQRNRLHPVEVFTSNYDLLLEQAFEESDAPFFDGFIGNMQGFFDMHSLRENDLPARWTRVWKLHGSINWHMLGKKIIRSAPAKEEPAVIHPSHLKYDQSRKMPFLALLDRLSAFLSLPSAILVTAGYSFRDDHINSVIGTALEQNHTATAYGLLFGSLKQYSDARALASNINNIALFSEDSAVVGSQMAEWRTRRDEPDTTPEHSPVRWEEVQGSDPQEWRPSVHIGNFDIFARFLSKMAGA